MNDGDPPPDGDNDDDSDNDEDEEMKDGDLALDGDNENLCAFRPRASMGGIYYLLVLYDWYDRR